MPFVEEIDQACFFLYEDFFVSAYAESSFDNW